MNKLIKSRIFFFILGAIIFGSISSVVAVQLTSKDIKYTKGNTEITVEEALNELYSKGRFTYVTGTNNRENGVETIEVLHDCDDAVIVSGQAFLLFSINSEDDYQVVEELGHNENAIGLYYKDGISLKKGDIIRIKRDTSGKFGYMIIY